MPSRTQIVCLHEGRQGHSIDPIFINALLKALAPPWLRPWRGSNVIRAIDCGGRATLIEKLPTELRACLAAGAHTTLMVWADLDHDMEDGDQLMEKFRAAARQADIGKQEFDRVVFALAKDRLENWVEFLLVGKTDESQEGPRQKHGKRVAEAARRLAARCKSGATEPQLPPSLAWSCQSWNGLVKRMRT